jgi:hypothetical protein
MIELWVFYTALLLNEIYLPKKFHVDTSCYSKLCPGQKLRMDRRTDGQSGDYMPTLQGALT